MGYRLYRFWAIFLALLLTLFVLLFTTGCNSQKKFIKYANNHKLELAELCAENFKPETKLIEGRTDTISKTEYKDSLVVYCPPVEAKTGQIIRNTVKCPPERIVTNVIHRTDTLKVNNPAKEYQLQTNLSKTEKDLKEEKASKAKWRNTALISIGVLIVCVIGWFMLGRR